MEARVSRVRGGSWRRGGRGGNDSDSFSGDHRGRGRGGHHRGRGKRDHYRGRGRGVGAQEANFHQRDQDERDDVQEEDDRTEVFSRRKLESNWDRYQESEKEQPADDTPTQRGTDYHVLLESAGDSFTQFRFSEEKDWETDPLTAGQMSAVFVDLPALAQILQQVPLRRRLDLEAELVQVSTPAVMPATTLAAKQEVPKTSKFTPPSAAFKNLDREAAAAEPGSDPRAPPGAAEPPDGDADDELDRLLGLQKPASGNRSAGGAGEESAAPEEAREEVKEEEEEEEEAIEEEEEQEEEEVKDVTPPKSVKQEMTEDDLEDWLDSMIS
ncbi:cell death regulator Aven [Brachyistius frenatus]|uniref:cell death regulator Aven n=1 Tax=Brachyistius frenatus TaxID=100188 RepID=UPI0037E6FA02